MTFFNKISFCKYTTFIITINKIKINFQISFSRLYHQLIAKYLKSQKSYSHLDIEQKTFILYYSHLDTVENIVILYYSHLDTVENIVILYYSHPDIVQKTFIFYYSHFDIVQKTLIL